MATIDEIGAMQAQEKDEAIPAELLTGPENSVKEEVAQGFRLDLSWLKAETGEGEIEDYVNHPLNFNGSMGIAQALRGFAGFMGNGSQLRFAVIDVLFGLNRFRKDLKPNG